MASKAAGALSGAGTGAATGAMIGGPYGAVIGGVVGGLAGLFSSGGDDDGKQYIDQAIQELIKVHIPDPESQRVALQRYYSTGELSPDLEQAISADPTALEKVVKNVKYTQAQDKALAQLQDLGEKGGLNLSDKAALQGQLITSANKDRANRSAITDEFERRGEGGSGMALQAQLGGAQAAGDRDAQARLQTLGGAQDRALQAIMGGGELAGKLDQQDYQRQADLAAARDRINQFNVQNAQAVRQRNTAAKNAAQAANLESRQNIANSNVDTANKEQMYNQGLTQKNFENEMAKAGAMANAYTGAATNSNQRQAQDNQMIGGGIGAIGQVGAGIKQDQQWKDYMEFLKKAKTQPDEEEKKRLARWSASGANPTV